MPGTQGYDGVRSAAEERRPAEASPFGSAEVLRQLAATLNLFRRFRDAELRHLNPWEEGSLSVAEQSLERAALAFSQLDADLHHPLRRQPKPDAQAHLGRAV